jgi:hypothetical protein
MKIGWMKIGWMKIGWMDIGVQREIESESQNQTHLN